MIRRTSAIATNIDPAAVQELIFSPKYLEIPENIKTQAMRPTTIAIAILT
jgi:hypothetical protein